MISRTISRTLLTLAATALSLSAVAAPVQAAEPQALHGGGHRMLQRHDADGDGTISLQEFQAARDPMFAHLDADGDGFVSRAEFDAAHTAHFNKIDVNGNGVIDADEMPLRRGGRHGHGQRD